MAAQQYSLQFSGFDSREPELQQRFKSICVADLELSVDDTQALLASEETEVITCNHSFETLTQLCGQLKAAGARVAILSQAHSKGSNSSLEFELDEILDLDQPIIPSSHFSKEKKPKEYHLDIDDSSLPELESFNQHDNSTLAALSDPVDLSSAPLFPNMKFEEIEELSDANLSTSEDGIASLLSAIAQDKKDNPAPQSAAAPVTEKKESTKPSNSSSELDFVLGPEPTELETLETPIERAVAVTEYDDNIAILPSDDEIEIVDHSLSQSTHVNTEAPPLPPTPTPTAPPATEVVSAQSETLRTELSTEQPPALPLFSSPPRAAAASKSTSKSDLIGFSRNQMIALFALGLGTLVGANYLLTSAETETETIVSEPEAAASVSKKNSATAKQENAPVQAERLITSDATVDGMTISFSAVHHPEGITARFSLVTKQPRELTIEEIGANAPTLIWLKRIESDSVILKNSSATEWRGTLPTYIYIEQGATRRRIPGSTSMVVKLNSDGAGVVKIALNYTPPNDKALPPAGVPIEATADGSYRISVEKEFPVKVGL